MLEKIKPFEDLTKIYKHWKTIFVSDDPFSNPFTNCIKERLVIYPTNGYYLTKDQYDAITKASIALEETGFFISITEYEEKFVQQNSNWWCEYPSYENYLKIVIPLENSLFSINSSWGVLISHEDHAIVGGTNKFIQVFKNYYPKWVTDIFALREAWSNNPESSWIDKINENNC